MSVFDKLKAAAGAVATKANEAVNAAIDRLIATADEITAAAPSLEKVGYRVTDLELEISLPPRILVHLVREFDAPDEAFQAVLAGHAGQKTFSTLVELLQQANRVQGRVRLKDREFRELTVDLSLPPAVRLKYKETGTRLKRVLFVCVENSNRSQMAEAFARLHGGDRIEAYSAGSRPSGQVSPKAVEAMGERGYDLHAHRSKSLSEVPDVEFDAAVTMGCGDACPNVKAKRRLDWDIPNPKELAPEQFRLVRDLIEAKVQALLKEIE